MFESIPPLQILLTKGPYIFAFEFGRYVIAACAVAAIAALMMRSRWRSRKIQPRNATGADIRREMWLSFQTSLVYLTVILFVVWGQQAGLFKEIPGSLGLGRALLVLAGIIIAHDAYFYWSHRMMHHPRLFKLFHRAHHRSITPTAFAAYSFAIPEAFIMVLFAPLWLMFVTTPAWVMFAWMAFQIIRNAMGHAGVELMPRWWLATPLTSWINTTTHHDLHHNGSFNRNYGLYFSWWDKLMGTEHPDYHARFAAVVAPTPRATVRPTTAAAA